jgi:hypothetical protein
MTNLYKTPSLSVVGALAAGGSDVIRVNAGSERITVAVFPGAGATVSVQISISPLSVIETGSPNYVDWDAGDVTADTIRVIDGPVNAVKITSTAGTADYEMLAI